MATMLCFQGQQTMSPILHETVGVLVKESVSCYLNFLHDSQHTILEHHQTAILKVLLTNHHQYTMMIMNVTCLCLQKPGNNDL